MTFSRDFKGIFISKEIWLDKRLSWFEKCLLAEIHSLDGQEGCFASNDYFVEFFGEKERTVQRGIAKLKDLGFIGIFVFKGNRRTIRLQKADDKIDTQSEKRVTNLTPPGDKSDTHRVTNLTPAPLTRVTIYENIVENIELDNSKSVAPQTKKQNSATALVISADAERLNKLFFSSLQKLNKNTKTPDLKRWEAEFDKLLRSEGMTPERIEKVLAWLEKDSFWRTVILSAKKFREKFSDLETKMLNPNAKPLGKEQPSMMRLRYEGYMPPKANIFIPNDEE